MKRVLIICAAGTSSSMMASKIMDFFKQEREEVLADTVSATEGDNMIRNSDSDLFLISPQTTMFSDKSEKSGEPAGKPVVSILFQVHVPIPTDIQKLAEVIEENIRWNRSG